MANLRFILSGNQCWHLIGSDSQHALVAHIMCSSQTQRMMGVEVQQKLEGIVFLVQLTICNSPRMQAGNHCPLLSQSHGRRADLPKSTVLQSINPKVCKPNGLWTERINKITSFIIISFSISAKRAFSFSSSQFPTWRCCCKVSVWLADTADFIPWKKWLERSLRPISA